MKRPNYINSIYGHSYFYNSAGVLSAVITNADGTPDWDCYDDENGLAVEDFAEKLTPHQIQAIETVLNKA